tara:strand:- start:2750 stop:3604 length:855 start_codon:yes stop_codon:yes gene_type:complete
MAGQIHSFLSSSTDDFVSIFDHIDNEETSHRVFISRLPQRRLVEHLDISDIECYWLTDRGDEGSLEPSYQKILTLINNRFSNHKGSIFLEGIEWLSSLHGFDELLGFIRTLSDSIHRTYWSLYLSIDKDSFSPIEFNQIIREAPQITIEIEESISHITEDSLIINSPPKAEGLEVELHQDGSPKLVMLTRLPESGFSKSILQRRVLQWRRMGLDVSEVESALYSSKTSLMYDTYVKIEEKVRRAVQLDNWISENVEDSQERSIAQFRIRQLTGLEELERRYFSN